MCISCTNLLIMLMCQHSRCARKTLMPDHCSPSWLGLRIKFLLLSVFWVSESSSCSDCCLGFRIKPALIVFCFLWKCSTLCHPGHRSCGFANSAAWFNCMVIHCFWH
jgi:hypothetical protein